MDSKEVQDGTSSVFTPRTSTSSSQHDTSIDDVPTPPYSEAYGQMDVDQGGLDTNARVTEDGRVNIKINEHRRGLSSLLASALPTKHYEGHLPPPYIPPSLGAGGETPPPPLNVVIHVVGSRGDVQPFVALGRVLKNTYGHRVRLATHPTFKKFVEENGLEFFTIGGDPAQLMAFMVKNPGLMPGPESLKNGDITKRRKEISTIIQGCWRSCFEAGDGTGVPVSDAKVHEVSFTARAPPFVADAIIANPPSFAHVHCAQKLGVPLHLMFTMPWSPTQAFPHPLANIQSSNADVSVTNYVSYALVEMMTWQGLGDIINRFREKSLGLEPISIMWAPAMIPRMRIPYTYCWSPALIPKPNDWGPNIDIAGFYFLSLASNYTPPDDLATFLASGPPPIYIGFGSIVVDDPNEMTRMILDAVRKTGLRALVSKGWGGIGAEEFDIPDGVFMLGNCPHDWLFKRVSCVVHHGGAGTTAAGIALGRPTVIVPFFGDQPFWGSMIGKAGAGPMPIPYKELTADKLADAIMQALQPAALEKAAELGNKIRHESGTETGANSFHKQLHMDDLRCVLAPSRVAALRVRRTDIRLSAFAVAVLVNEGLLDLNDIKLYHAREYDTEPEPREPITGGGAALIGNIGDFVMGCADLPYDMKRGFVDPPARLRASSRPKSPIPIPKVVEPSSDTKPASAEGPEGNEPDKSSTLDNAGDRESPVDKTSSSEGRHRSSSRGSRRDANKEVEKAEQVSVEAVINAGRTAGKIFNTGMKTPMNFTLAVARGFHNAPLLYGDDTVRETHRVTGIKSGVKAAGKEFGYGFFDGISGLATQPIAGARKEGAAGAIKGFGKGIGGLVLKPAAGVWALTGYTMNGIFKQIQRQFGESVEGYVIASRLAQGAIECEHSSPGERTDIIRRWQVAQAGLQEKKKESLDRRTKSERDFRPPADDKRELQKAAERANRRQGFLDLFKPRDDSSVTQSRSPSIPNEYEEAIQESVLVTSKGNPEEDELIERALRASMVELKAAEAAGEDQQHAYDRAAGASIIEAKRVQAEHQASRGASQSQKSETIQSPSSHAPQLPPRYAVAATPDDNEDADFQRALAESKQMHEEAEKRAQAEKSEMDVVMEYIKKQSLAEFEYRQQAQGSAEAATDRNREAETEK